MKIKLTCAIFFILLLANFSEARDIRVMLSNSKKYHVTADAGMTATDAQGKSHSIGKSATLAVSGGSVVIAGKKAPLPLTIKSSGHFGFKGYKYRGVLRITQSGALVNVLDVEDYTRGVIKAEANPNWHMEYLKVQAIVSRTFGLRESLSAGSKEYDVVDSTASQVYHGANAETPRTDQAVRETASKVLAYGNELAGTYFHSDSGGATANISDVWGSNVPYLRATKEPVAYTSPNSTWEKRVSAAELSRALQKSVPGIGTVKEIRIVNTDAFGRAVDLKITGTAGATTMKASTFRTAAGPNGIKSTFFTAAGTPTPSNKPATTVLPESSPKPVKTTPPVAIKPNANVDINSPMTPEEDARLTQLVTDGEFSGKEMMEILTKPEKRKEYLYKALERLGEKTRPAPQSSRPTPSSPPIASSPLPSPIESGKAIPFENGHFVFRGRGWGHGVGLSQYGGMALANAGWHAEKILTHYFPGTSVKIAK